MKFRNILYIVLMVIFMAFTYLLFDRGINAKTKIYASYQDSSDLIYKVYLHDNDVYNEDYLNMNERYISKLVDYIDIDFIYKSLFDKDISGYYSYDVIGSLVAYENNIDDILWKREYTLLDSKTEVLNSNNLRNIDINDKVVVDYDKYKKELEKFYNDYGIYVSGYLEVMINIKENLDFSGMGKITVDDKDIKLIIPLSSDTFRIDVINNNNKIGSYYDFSNKGSVNYILLLFGILSLSIGMSFLALTIRNMIIVSRGQFSYEKELKKILDEHEDKIVSVKRFYNIKKYNLIYVDSFKELLDAYEKVGNPISYREVKKNQEAIFLMTEDDNAWIYRMVKKNK